MATAAQLRAQVEGEIVAEVQRIEHCNGDLDFVNMQATLALLGLQNQDGIFRFPPQPDAKGHTAVQAACHSYANRIHSLVSRLSECDPHMRQNVLFGGSDNILVTSNPPMLKYLDRLFLFVSGAQSFLMSISSALLPCLDEAQYDRWKLSENVSTRWAAAMHENELRNWSEGRYQPHQMLIRVVKNRLAMGDGMHSYVLYHDQVYKRKYIDHRSPLVKCASGNPIMPSPEGNQYVCKHCGKPESEHRLQSVSDRKAHVFERLTVPMTDASSALSDQDSGLVVQIATPCYEPLMTEYGRAMDLTDFLYKLTAESFSLWMSSTTKIQNIESVTKAVLSDPNSATRLRTDPGVFGFEDGIWHARECRWFPYVCECHDYACPGRSHASDFTKGIFIQDNPERIEMDSDMNIAALGLSEGRKTWGFRMLIDSQDDPLRNCEHPFDMHSDLKTMCEHCGAGMWGDLVPTKFFKGAYMDYPRKLAKMVGPLVPNYADHVCQLCGKKRDDPDHKPSCQNEEGYDCPFFLSNPENPVKCIWCDNEVDAHEPACRGCFTDRISDNTRFQNRCIRCNRIHNSATNPCACPGGAQLFKMNYTPTKSSWHALSPPAWCGLFTSQFQGMEAFVIRRMITMMIARSWFPAQMFDSLHIMVQLTGPGGNGKSTIIEFLMSFWDQKDIGVIPNNAQKTFPFEQAINYFMKCAKPCIVFPEIKSNTQIDMADVLRLCEAPDMFVFNRKNQTPLTTACKATIWTASNQFWGTDVGGSASRRTLLVRLPNQIRKSQADGKLRYRLDTRERAAIVLMASYDFAYFRHNHRSLELSNYLNRLTMDTGVDYFQKRQRDIEENLNLVMKFLANVRTASLKIVGGASNIQDEAGNISVWTASEDACGPYISYRRFVDAFKKVLGWKGSVIPPSTLEQPFKYYGICYDPKKTETRTERINVDGEIVEKQVPGPWVYGIKDLKVMGDDDDDDDGDAQESSGADLTSMMNNLRIGNVPLENTPDLVNAVQQFGGYIDSDSVGAFTMLMLDRLTPQFMGDPDGEEERQESLTQIRDIRQVLQKTLQVVSQREQAFISAERKRTSAERKSAKRPRTSSFEGAAASSSSSSSSMFQDTSMYSDDE